MGETKTTVVEKEETLLEKLITKEDPLHVHKALGILCLISYVFRFSMVGESDMGFKTHPEWTLPTLLLHLLLNLSAFEFKIPSKRISSGYRIWPEYRLHSLVFTARSLACILVDWYYLVYPMTPDQYYLANFIVQMLTIFFADVSSWSVKHRSGFSRELDIPAFVRYFFSAAQLLLVPALVLDRSHRFSMIFYSVMVIQGNAFLMTMRRKNIAGHWGLIAIYGFWLAFGISMVAYDMSHYASGLNSLSVMALVGSAAVLLRVGPRLPVLSLIQNNKYLLWTVLGAVFYWMRPDFATDELPKPLEPTMVRGGAVAGLVSLVALGVHKQLADNAKQAAATKKTT